MDNRFYFDTKNQFNVEFLDQEYIHLTRVRRCKVGDLIIGFNGDGFDYHLKIVTITKDKVVATIIDKQKNKSFDDMNITVYLALIKNDALTSAIDHLAELNVKTVKLFKSDFSVVTIDEKKVNKLNQISIQASKQCERADIMKVELIEKSDIKNDIEKYKNRFFAYENSTDSIKKFSGDFAVIIGPEGGFSQDEVNYFSNFADTISISKTILRAEVACVTAVSALRAVQDVG